MSSLEKEKQPSNDRHSRNIKLYQFDSLFKKDQQKLNSINHSRLNKINDEINLESIMQSNDKFDADLFTTNSLQVKSTKKVIGTKNSLN